MRMKITNSQNLNFQARKIALTKNVFNGTSTHIDLYELSGSDVNFLQKLKDKIKIAELMPNLKDGEAKSWQDVLDFTINAALDKSIKKYVAISGEKPCGIMALKKEGRVLNLLGISSIPVDVNKKVAFSGSTLFCHLFSNAKKSKTKKVILEALRNSHFDLVTKYKEKGFFVGQQGERYISMSCPSYNIRAQLKRLQAATSYVPAKSKKDVSLDSFI